MDPFEYISLNSRHKNTLKFCHTYPRTENFKYTVFNRFPAYFDHLPQNLRDQLLLISQVFNEHKESLQKTWLELKYLYVIICFKDSHPC